MKKKRTWHVLVQKNGGQVIDPSVHVTTKGRQHVDSPDCWCRPTMTKDPKGPDMYYHRERV